MTSEKRNLTFEQALFHFAEMAFGEMGFMLTVPQEELASIPEDIKWLHGCQVDFTGPFNGKIFLLATDHIVEPLTLNMLGLMSPDELPPGVDTTDSLKEMANVICGNILPAIAGDDAVFDIGGPEITDTPAIPESIAGLKHIACRTLPVEEGFIRVAFFVDEKAKMPESVEI